MAASIVRSFNGTEDFRIMLAGAIESLRLPPLPPFPSGRRLVGRQRPIMSAAVAAPMRKQLSGRFQIPGIKHSRFHYQLTVPPHAVKHIGGLP